ncbi:hypothetical protein D3C76_1069410 [compost metagenome]
MEKFFCQADLSGGLSPDEERVLNLYRNISPDERQMYLFRLSRQLYLPWFADEYDPERDAVDSTYLVDELEQQLFLLAPWWLLGEFLGDEPHRSALVQTAWNYAAPVLLGVAENDGFRADQLFNSAIGLWDCMDDGPSRRGPLDFTRQKALVFLEKWREEVLHQLFTRIPSERGDPNQG